MERHVIYGPPGTGKSTEIIRRVKEYVNSDHFKPEEIGLCSYTKAAATVLKERCDIDSKWVGTLHSLAFKLSKCIYSQTINHRKLKEFSKLSGIAFTGANPDEAEQELSNGDYYLALYGFHHASLGKEYMNTYDCSDRPGCRDEFKFFVDAYTAWKKSTGFIDFNDMLIKALHSDNPPIEVLFIDEAQDLSPLQWALVNRWSQTIPIIHIAGDDDQAIYQWAGADPKGMLYFEKKHDAKRTILNQSFRIPVEIHKKASDVISNVSERVDKEYKPKEAKGNIEYYSGIECIVDLEPDEDVLILYRNHSLREDVEDFIISKGYPYITDNGKPGLCQGWYWKLITLFNRIKKEGVDRCALTSAENKLLIQGLHEHLKLKLGTDKSKDIFSCTWKEALNIPSDKCFYFEMIEQEHTDFNIKPSIHLSTIHGSKGREADRVILMNGLGSLSAQKFYSGDTDGEARVFYVAVTRAKKRLDIVQADNSIGWL